MKKSKAPPRAALTLLFAAIVFCVLVVTMLIVGSVALLLVRADMLKKVNSRNVLVPIALLAFVSILIGTVVAAVTSRVPLKPINNLINGMNRLAEGEYDTRINLGNYSVGKEISKSFNILAEELMNTEMLRSDFINNFSHEFKTPIVSIRGFAKLLRKGNLSSEQQREYLDIIVNESSRLADMATNVLNLTKVENQSILTDITCFNLSEQIRDCVLLLEKKWSGKGLTVRVDFDEYSIHANEELLMQVWINLIDNAVKFSPEAGEIGISIAQADDMLTVLVKNNGPYISPEERNRIFNKFWQGDTSHASEGTGIGLSIARRITTLHKGVISVASSLEETVFSVRLPSDTVSK